MRRPLAAFFGMLATSLLSVATCAAAGTEEARLSPGCGQPPPQKAPANIVVDGRQRDLITAVPAPYEADKPHDLVVAFHGLTNSNADVRDYYDLEDHALRPALFVYPSGLPTGEGRRSWSDPGDAASELRDYALFDAIVARVEREYCIDRGRVFAVGHSLGAWFVNSLSCARGKVLRGIGAVAGGISASECTGQVAAIIVHNPKDRLVDFSHGEEVRDLLLRRNGLMEGPGQSEAGAEHLNCVRYGDPGHRHPVLWCPHTHDWTRRDRFYPHQWPQGTGAVIMTFFGALRGPSARFE